MCIFVVDYVVVIDGITTSFLDKPSVLIMVYKIVVIQLARVFED